VIVKSAKLPGVLLFKPTIYKDSRGHFLETFNKDYGINFVQSNISKSGLNVLRGLHAQKKNPQGKLLTVLSGQIYDVVVDPKTGKWQGFDLDDCDFSQIYIPPGYFHGFYSKQDDTIIEYKCTQYYDPKDEIGVVWNDKTLNIDWPAPYPIVSSKDAKLPNFSLRVGDL
jgi:dTDP-4-dehydrorhamnose 3,5-epimerase